MVKAGNAIFQKLTCSLQICTDVFIKSKCRQIFITDIKSRSHTFGLAGNYAQVFHGFTSSGLVWTNLGAQLSLTFCRLEKANKGPMHAMKFVVFIHSCIWIEGKYPMKDYFLTFFRDLLANE